MLIFTSFSLLQLNRFRKVNRMHVQGPDIPDPVRSFDELRSERLHPKVLENLASVGFTEPTPIQMQAIPLMMQVGNSLLFNVI